KRCQMAKQRCQKQPKAKPLPINQKGIANVIEIRSIRTKTETEPMETRSKRFGQGLRKHVWVWGMFILIGTLLLGSCNNAALIDEFKPIPNKRWSYNFMPTFRVHVLDTTKAYRLKVNFR